MIEYNMKEISEVAILVMFRDTETDASQVGDTGSDVDLLFLCDVDDELGDLWSSAQMNCTNFHSPSRQTLLLDIYAGLMYSDPSTLEEIEEFCEVIAEKKNEKIFSYEHLNQTSDRR